MANIPIPFNLSVTIDAHKKWLRILKEAQDIVEYDANLQAKAKRGLLLKERHVPVEVLGRIYGQYCHTINKLYDSYLNNVQLQRATYIMEIITVFLKRIYELRNEIVHLVVNDYIYVDGGLIQTKLTPDQIEIIIPYHYPLECRADSSEQLLQKMWVEAVKRKNAPPKRVKPRKLSPIGLFQSSDTEILQSSESSEEEEEDENNTEESSVPDVLPVQFIQVNIIQRHERFRQFFIANIRSMCLRRKTYFVEKADPPPPKLREAAARIIQMTYREFMKSKRRRIQETRRDVILGLVPDPWRKPWNYKDENNMIYEKRMKTRTKLHEIFLKELEKEKIRLIVFKREDQIEDITKEIRDWFKEWYYGYGFFPEFPFELEGGTLLVARGDYPTIDEKIEADEKYFASIKGKTKEQLKHAKLQAKLDAELKAELERGQKKKDAEVRMKQRCNPFTDPGYQVQQSDVKETLINALQKYRGAWSIYDKIPLKENAEVVFGFMRTLLTEDLMQELHKDCRKFVDELMRLDLKLLIKSHQMMYKRMGKKYPKQMPRSKPKLPPIPKTLNINSAILKGLEPLFDLNIITKPTTKLKDVFGDSNYVAYDYNIRDPDATFPIPGYGDIKRRLVYSCVYGIGFDPGATRRKAVMLLGPPRNGKSYLVEAVTGELDAVKIDISPEVFSSKVPRPAKTLSKVLIAARAFQPTVIFMRNVETVFAKRVRPETKRLNARKLKKSLPKMLKNISDEDKIIFIATCSDPSSAKRNSLKSTFDELILVPRTDYGSLQRFFYDKLQSIRSMPRDYNVQPIAQLLQGYGFGIIIEVFNSVMNPERITRLNWEPLSPLEFLEPLIREEIEPVSLEDYQVYVNFFLSTSPLSKEREEYAIINRKRAAMYDKMAAQNDSDYNYSENSD